MYKSNPKSESTSPQLPFYELRRYIYLSRKTGKLRLLNLHSLVTVIVNLDNTTNGTNRASSDNILDAHDVAPMSDPVEGDVSKDIDKSNQGNDVRDTCACRVGNGALDRGEDSSSRDTHDQDTSTAASVAAEIRGPESEDGRVHGSLEKEDDDQDGDSRFAMSSADISVESDGKRSVDHKEEVGLENDCKGDGDETADGEGDQGI